MRIRIALGDGVVNASLIIGSVADERGQRSRDLVKQGLDLRAIIEFTTRSICREDLPSVGVNTDVQLSPGAASSGAMLLDQPFAGTTELQACAVHQQVNRPSGAKTWPWYLQGFGPLAQG
ncbi:hypothetical protein BB934_28565 (plasmid) [Microvirga ossetica]|uniref:Uncharacterized protein n=1 Tax=Microvirga ossetica TaxID=1882682 RepID=A0A1B2EQP7_9HYPH|nr:hypothetical protein BB934_28565 [Microvirga ossetica]